MRFANITTREGLEDEMKRSHRMGSSIVHHDPSSSQTPFIVFFVHIKLADKIMRRFIHFTIKLKILSPDDLSGVESITAEALYSPSEQPANHEIQVVRSVAY